MILKIEFTCAETLYINYHIEFHLYHPETQFLKQPPEINVLCPTQRCQYIHHITYQHLNLYVFNTLENSEKRFSLKTYFSHKKKGGGSRHRLSSGRCETFKGLSSHQVE